MLVSELTQSLNRGTEQTPVAKLEDVVLNNQGLVVPGLDSPILMDEVGLKKLGKYLDMNTSYLDKCPPDLQQINVNYWFKRYGSAEAMFHTVDGQLTNVHRPDKQVIPLVRVAEAVSRAFQPEDEVKTLSYDDDRLEVDILSSANSILVPGLGTDHRPMNDITHGGLRLHAFTSNGESPYVQTYLHRLVCSNGLAIDEPELQVKLKGNTVPEILAELETVAQQLMSNMPERLEAYRHLSDVPIVGNLEQFVYQVGRESGLGSRVMDRVMLLINDLPLNPTLYDVTQVFTQIAGEGVTRTTRLRLQNLGGQFVSDTHNMLDRCNQCKRPLI
jgi:hypothetical protein